jgi:hypothetical protein
MSHDVMLIAVMLIAQSLGWIVGHLISTLWGNGP